MRNNLTERTIITVTLVNIGMNFLLAIFKIFIGIIGYSQALIADGVHSFSDVITDTFVYITARASQHHPDKEHPYGHQRIETLGTILIAIILIGVAGSIVYDAVIHLTHHAQLHIPSISVVIVAISAIGINELLFHYSKKQGEKINSNLLISNAWHKRSDVFVSIIVLLSVIGSLLGLKWFDAIGALIIAGIIFKIAGKMIWESIQQLIDHGVDEKTLDDIIKIIQSIPGVYSIHQLRTRLHGNYIFVDLHIIVDSHISVSEGHHIGEEVHSALLKNIKNLYDVTVHIDPENDEIAHPSLHLPNRKKILATLATHWSSLPGYSAIEKMNLHYLEGKLSIEVFIDHNTVPNILVNELEKQYREAAQDMPHVEQIRVYFSDSKQRRK